MNKLRSVPPAPLTWALWTWAPWTWPAVLCLLLFSLWVAPGFSAGAQEPPSEPAAPAATAKSPAAAPAVSPGASPVLGVAPDGAVLSGTSLELKVTLEAEGAQEIPLRLILDGRTLRELKLAPGEHSLKIPAKEAALGSGHHELILEATASAPGVEPARVETTFRTLPGWLSVLPPLVAIALALLLRDVLLSLFAGIFVGALTLVGGNPLAALGHSVDHFVAASLADSDHAKILLFTLLLGGMVGLMTKSGGTVGIVERLAPFATTRRRGQLATWFMGVLVFFDDYANSLIVGSTMRPISDRLRISREKLSYIVDSTAAPISSLVPISTWIGFEVGLLAGAMTSLELPYNAYTTFMASIPYRFYPLLALVLGFAIAITGRDFGPMRRAERRAVHRGEVIAPGDTAIADYSSQELAPPPGIRHRASNALLPILTVIIVTIWGLVATGSANLSRADFPSTGAWLRQVFSDANSYDALLWASLAGAIVALLLPLLTRVLSLTQGMEALVAGFKAMLLALIVLTLAWSIGSVCEELRTADYLVELTSGELSPRLLPVLVFVLAAAIAFATGTSWATMAILVPLAIPILDGLAREEGLVPGDPAYWTLLLGTVSSVLAGAVAGDHCSPISDTTILSSMGSASDHIAHVRTQLPYALTVAGVGMVVGDVPTAFGLSPWISLLAGSVILVGILYWRGRKAEDRQEEDAVDAKAATTEGS